MTDYALTREADRDIEGIARESIARWGWSRAEAYVEDLHEAFAMLARFPKLGRDVGYVRPGCRRFERASHVVFYRGTDDGVLIVRVLHRRMEPRRHL